MTSPETNNHHDWSKLPSPVLSNILIYAQQSSKLILQNNAPLLCACQLVCKGWSQPAQEALYKQVHLGSNTLRFLDTITGAKELGDLVKTLVIEQGMTETGDMFDILENITDHCPNIEELYSLDEAVRNDVWTYLTSAKKVPRHLKAFTTPTSDAFSSPLYSPLAIRLAETLTQLQINFNATLFNNAEQGSQSLLLSRRLGHFIALQKLRVDHWRLKSWQDFDILLNRCPATLRELVLIHLDLSNDKFPQTYEIHQNTHIKWLKIGASDVPAAALQYLSFKLAALEKFDLLFVTFPEGSLQDVNVWWAYLMEMCMNLVSYNIKFAHCNYQDIYQLRNCMKFSAATSNQWSKDIKSKSTHLSINTTQEEDNVISLFKASWQTYSMYFQYDKLTYLELISQWMKNYSPQYIRIQGESMDKQYQMITTIDAAQTHEEVTAAARSLLEKICNKRDSHMFFTPLFFVEDEDVKVLHFDCMVLCYTYSLGNNTLRNLQVSNLKFTNSILHHQVLECISKMFVKINKLTLDTCCILMDDHPFQLHVRLPFTEMAALELCINPFVNATSWLPHKKKMYSEACTSLENLYLQRAVTEDGHFVVVIETQDKTQVFHKQGAGDIKRSLTNPSLIEGNAFNFVIRIECKQVEEVRIRGEHGLKWDIKLE